ncbi:protein of unknown function [Aminobacter niigataensis]|nr:protein of unknown function [Aminobacter niigataensis]
MPIEIKVLRHGKPSPFVHATHSRDRFFLGMITDHERIDSQTDRVARYFTIGKVMEEA